jgi:hypothetical protein
MSASSGLFTNLNRLPDHNASSENRVIKPVFSIPFISGNMSEFMNSAAQSLSENLRNRFLEPVKTGVQNTGRQVFGQALNL